MVYGHTEYNNDATVSTTEPVNVMRFRQIATELAYLYAKKNHDYGDSFAESVEKFGYVAGAVRLSDKFNRICSLIQNGDAQVKDESLIDTLLDNAAYSIMLAIEVEKRTQAQQGGA